MILEFRVENFRSFRTEQVLSLVATGWDQSLPENVYVSGKIRALNSVAIYGPNASGKSNLIKAMSTMREIVSHSATGEPGAKLPLTPFKLDPDYDKRPSKFEVTFLLDGCRYQYGFAATPDQVWEEWLIAYPRQYAQTWFHRSLKAGSGEMDWNFSSHLKGDKRRLAEKTRSDSLFLSVGAQWNNQQLRHVYDWFRLRIRDLPAGAEVAPITANLCLGTSPPNVDSRTACQAVADFLRDADLGLDDVRVERMDPKKMSLPSDLPPDVKRELMEDLERHPPLKVQLKHVSKMLPSPIFFSLSEESDGTQRLFSLAGPWFEAIANGFLVVIDEIETSLHSLLTRQLIEYFRTEEASEKHTQIIFATHDTTLLDPELFRRDQIWFTEKDEWGATQIYSLAEFKNRPRKGEPMQKGYLAGRYGAIPILESFERYREEEEKSEASEA